MTSSFAVPEHIESRWNGSGNWNRNLEEAGTLLAHSTNRNMVSWKEGCGRAHTARAPTYLHSSRESYLPPVPTKWVVAEFYPERKRTPRGNSRRKSSQDMGQRAGRRNAGEKAGHSLVVYDRPPEACGSIE